MNVLVMSSGINTQEKVMKICMIQKENGQEMTLQKSQMMNGKNSEEKLISYAEVTNVKHLASLENEEGSQTLEGHCSLKLQGRPNKSNHAYYCLRTSQGYYHTTKEKRSLQSLPRWMNWGKMQNGKILTARIS